MVVNVIAIAIFLVLAALAFLVAWWFAVVAVATIAGYLAIYRLFRPKTYGSQMPVDIEGEYSVERTPPEPSHREPLNKQM